MNPDSTGSEGLLTRFWRLFQRRQERQAAHDKRRGDHRPRAAATLKKHRRQMAQASRRDQRRLAKGQPR